MQQMPKLGQIQKPLKGKGSDDPSSGESGQTPELFDNSEAEYDGEIEVDQ